ncbi:MAG TPA: zinc ribbon domain-containing protein [Nitrososphaeraceae archaeon]|nr:zinc ribbon domain-containing protein [Nitrososphaeraceae archaeon]
MTMLQGPEQTIWHNEITKGIFHKKVVEVQLITNYRVLRDNFGISLQDLDDIVVMNQRRISSSQYTGTYMGRYTRVGFGNSTSRSITVGDVVFMYHGSPYIRFSQISDPNGVARLAKAARKRILQAAKSIQKAQTQSVGASKEKQSSKIDRVHPEINTQNAGKQQQQQQQEHTPPPFQWQLSHPMVSLDLIQSNEYDVKVNNWPEGLADKNKGYNKMLIHPIEKGNYIEFRNEQDKNYNGYIIELHNVINIDVMGNSVGPLSGFLTKTDPGLSLSFKAHDYENDINTGVYTIVIGISEKFALEIKDKVRSLKNIENAKFWSNAKDYTVIKTSNADRLQIKSRPVYLLAPFLNEEEEVLWFNVKTNMKTFIKSIEAITNFRILQYDYEEHGGNYIGIVGFDEPEVSNLTNTSKDNHSNIEGFVHSKNTISELKSQGMTSAATTGDVSFALRGKPFIIFKQVGDPVQVCKLAKTAKERKSEEINSNKKIASEYIRIHEDKKNEDAKKKITATIACSQCGSINPDKSRFCNKCGSKLLVECTKCNAANPHGSSFCNKCGFALS